MVPTLLPGDRLLVVPARRLRPGDLVVVGDLVKRVVSSTRTTVTVTGDNSGRLGPFPRSDVVGRAVYRYAPADRAGRLRRPRA